MRKQKTFQKLLAPVRPPSNPPRTSAPGKYSGGSGHLFFRKLDTQKTILGMALSNYRAAFIICGTLNTGDFSLTKHQIIFEAVKALFDQGAPVTLRAVAERLVAHGQLEQVGGRDYLATFAGHVLSANWKNAVHYCRNIRSA